MRTYKDLHYKETGDPSHSMNLYLPDEGDSFPVFVYFHGGGLVHGDANIVPHWPEYMTQKGVAVISAHYRLYPDAKFPEFLQDAADAILWAKTKMQEYCKVEKIYVGGSSAGGYISMMLCFDTQYLKGAGIDPMEISGYVFNAGQPTSHFNVIKEKGYSRDRIIVDEAAPLYYVGIEKQYPPMLFLVADNDMKNRYEQNLLMMDTLRWNGHEDMEFHYLHAGHCGYDNRIDENGESIFGKFIFDFICRTSKKEERA